MTIKKMLASLKSNTLSEVVQKYVKDPAICEELLHELDSKKLSQKKCKRGIKSINYFQLCRQIEWGTFIIQDSWLYTAAICLPTYFQFNPFKPALVFVTTSSQKLRIFNYVPRPFKKAIPLRRKCFLQPNFHLYYVFIVENEKLTLVKKFYEIENAKKVLAISKSCLEPNNESKCRNFIVLYYHE